MVNFFLRPEQRTAERMRYPGSNVDYERFQSEVMIPLQQNREFSYCPYNCRMQKLDAPVCVQQNKICIIEGAYSCRPELIENYALKIFLTTAKEEQLCRIERRNGKESVQAFVEKWIPMEENYIEAFEIEKRCDFIFET